MNTRTDPVRLLSHPVHPARAGSRHGHLLGKILLDLGEISPGDLIKAVALSAREDAKFGSILRTHNMISEHGLYRGLAAQFDCDNIRLSSSPPDIRLIDQFGADQCLRHGVVPWKRLGATLIVATSRPEIFDQFQKHLPADYGRVMMAVAPESDIQNALLPLRRKALVKRAETRVPHGDSCRYWQNGAIGRYVVAGFLMFIALAMIAPRAMFFALSIWAVFTLIINTAMKCAAAIAMVRDRKAQDKHDIPQRGPARKLPTVSVMVPLFKEREIAGNLVRRLNRLTYPRELLDICLVIEEDDNITQKTLADAKLPIWMRQVEVPRGSLKTKPRALNYALDFCRGSIIGVYDAEDAPQADQIHKVARRFHDAPENVACLQGVLDFYNPKQNWLARCFTIEYATWFRVILPGLVRMGFAIPLGGTTLFFRRSMLEKLGAWDAHNVTEDADLGIRLARQGYRTEMLPSTTYEEANCRAWPWVKQRSRWLKGYALTWLVHAKSPRSLLRDLGPYKFWGVQILFCGTLSQFLLAPVMWSFWAMPLGLSHPLNGLLSHGALLTLAAIFITSEIVNLAVGVYAVSNTRHRRLWPWVPTLHLYFPMAAIASYKAFWEMIVRPFYWDKTSHGLTGKWAGEQKKLQRRSVNRRWHLHRT